MTDDAVDLPILDSVDLPILKAPHFEKQQSSLRHLNPHSQQSR